MVETVSTDKLFRQLQNAITSKLRSVTHTDAIRLWEQDLRRHALECLAQKAKSDTQVADMLKTIPLLDQAGGVKLSDFLAQMTTFTGQLQKSKCKYPVRLMQAIAIKPLNVQAALDHLNFCALEKLSAKQVFCATVLKAELLSATGSVQEAYALLKPLMTRKNQPLSLHFSCSMRFAKLSRTRNTAETESTLTEIIRQINTSKSANSMWRHELAECTHELATLLMQCGRHQEALLWVQRSLQTWQLLSQDQPDRIDVQLMHAASLRSLSVAQDELGRLPPVRHPCCRRRTSFKNFCPSTPKTTPFNLNCPKATMF